MKKKLMAVALATIIAVMAVAGASLAWLKDTTDPVINTFTEGKVDITLVETPVGENGSATGNTYKMVPGDVLPKDPKVTVLAVSEACWVFVKVEEINDVETFLDYEIADGWTQLKDASNNDIPGVYYRTVDDTDKDQEFYVLKADKGNKFPNGAVTVNTSVEMKDMNKLNADTYPKLKFTAYAIQAAHFDTPAAAWEEASK